jgi:hypothetical protein
MFLPPFLYTKLRGRWVDSRAGLKVLEKLQLSGKAQELKYSMRIKAQKGLRDLKW